MNEIYNTLKETDNEGTDSPYWVIINEMSVPYEKDKLVGDDIYPCITGIFFSRKDAEDHLNSRRYAFSKNAQIWCLSGYWSKKYKLLWRKIEDEKRNEVKDV